MKKSDLRTGMIIETREGYHYRVFLNAMIMAYGGTIEDKLIRIDPEVSSSWLDLDSFDDDLIYNRSLENNLTIMKVLVSRTSCDLVCKYTGNEEVIWERKKVKEMTMEELEEYFDCKIKIVNAK